MTEEAKNVVKALRFFALGDQSYYSRSERITAELNAAALIEQLESDLASKERDYAVLLQETVDRGQKIRELEKQLAAALGDMKYVFTDGCMELCAVCANRRTDEALEVCEMHEYDCDECTRECACRECRNSSGFAWRGLCAENGGAEDGTAD